MSKFDIIEHQVPCSYIREYPRGLASDQEDQLYLSVKQYKPRSNPEPRPGDITIIGAHANGFAKEVYEPLWDDLLQTLEQTNSPFRVRSIWIADVAHQGESYAMNEDKLGDDPHWNDHARDLAHLVNLHRKEMPRPIFGLGHSMGGCQLVNLALAHPRLLTGLILLDPVIQAPSKEHDAGGPSLAAMSTFRRDIWPSRDDAEKSFKKSPFYQAWDPRVLNLWVQYGLRSGPTLLHPSAKPPHVVLATPPAHEVHTFLRPNFAGYGASKGVPVDRNTHADLDETSSLSYPFYRPEANITFDKLGELRPPVLYVSGGTSQVSHPKLDQQRLNVTGAGRGGSGGAKEGRVQLVTLEGVGHLVAQEAPQRTAKEVVGWVAAEMDRWRAQEEKLREEYYSKGTVADRQAITEEWKKYTGGLPKRPAKKTGDASKL